MHILRASVATVCVAVIFALGLLAVSPALHDQLHPGDHAPANDHCAVVLFAGGVSVSLPVIAPPPPSAEWSALLPAVSTEVLLESPRYLLRPERGPPAV